MTELPPPPFDERKLLNPVKFDSLNKIGDTQLVFFFSFEALIVPKKCSRLLGKDDIHV